MKPEKRRVDYRSRLTKDQIWTVPNVLSFVRLALIPLIVWLYIGVNQPVWALAIIVLSGITDIVDGFIARHFNMITDFGKMIDPVADKLTQMAMLYCVGTTFPEIRLLLILLVMKEVLTGAMSLISIKKTGHVQAAQWHGKVVTVLLYILIADKLLPGLLSGALLLVCIGMMILSAALYWKRNWDSIKGRSQ